MRFALGLLAASVLHAAAPRVESNVIFGMYSGLALLMESARVQCVVARAAPADLAAMTRSGGGGGAVTSFIGMPAPNREIGSATESRIYREASPVSHVTGDDAPVLLMHGDADDTVPIAQSEIMEAALRKAGVAVKFLRVPKGTHGPTFGNPPNAPDYMGEMVKWLNARLLK